MSGVGWVFSIECKELGRVYFQSEKKDGHDATNLNVEVVGREGVDHEGGPFVVQLKQKWVASFMKKQGNGEKDVERWIQAVRFVFLGELGDGEEHGWLDDVVVDAEYSEEDEDMNLAIKQRFTTESTEVFTILGELRLSRKRSHKIAIQDLLANSCTLLGQTNRSYRETDQRYRALDRRMNEFLEKKQQSDDEMMRRFLLLLNAKKQKINELEGVASMRYELANDEDPDQHSNNADEEDEQEKNNNNDPSSPESENDSDNNANPTANEPPKDEPAPTNLKDEPSDTKMHNTNPAAYDSEAETTDDEE
ncbi:hypothetical protein TRICI_006491 [Trichomonascus ciferrii]|uniref:Uncharacterized protein n=1 Tax=Trichomonascus ciferrii TaxID=44093 RepID=A0A642UGS8_9ASCO|nr:hypothetical protein TRICI_006491 [Trichomonascus ciferrii]